MGKKLNINYQKQRGNLNLSVFDNLKDCYSTLSTLVCSLRILSIAFTNYIIVKCTKILNVLIV